MPPDWMHAHDKRRQQEQWQAERAALAQEEQGFQSVYDGEPAAALREFLSSAEGQAKYAETYRHLVELYKRTEPERFEQAANAATLARIEKVDLQFPEFATWKIGLGNNE